MLRILLTQDSFFGRNPPVKTQGFIQNADTSIRFRVVEIVTFILEDGCPAQHGKSVGKALRNEELAVVVFGQFHGHVLSVSRASFADVYRYIQYATFHAAFQFALCTHLLFKFLLRERFEEIPSRILKNAWFNNYHSLYACLDYFHNSS